MYVCRLKERKINVYNLMVVNNNSQDRGRGRGRGRMPSRKVDLGLECCVVKSFFLPSFFLPSPALARHCLWELVD